VQEKRNFAGRAEDVPERGGAKEKGPLFSGRGICYNKWKAFDKERPLTQLLQSDPASVAFCAELIRKGEIVAFPTETVYGLGADGFCPDAIRAVFAAKERPADNPLIYHIHSLSQWEDLAEEKLNLLCLMVKTYR